MLELSHCVTITDCCKTITVTDCTGDYDATTNTTGWGAPNDARTDIVTATLVVTGSDLVDYTIDVTAALTAGTDISIVSDDIGLGADVEITSGVYYFTLTVDTGTEYTFDVTRLFYCTEEKAFKNLLGTFNPDKCGCGCSEETALQNILDIWTYMQILKNAACCGKVDKFTELLEIINQLLGDNPCSNC